jgi:prepilin peptidase CpaA
MLSLIDQLSIVGFAGLLLWAAVSDARTMKIPNRITLAIAALWSAHAAVSLIGGAPFLGILGALGVALGAFALGALLFHLSILGGGDVKLYAAVALWAGPQMLPLFSLIAVAAGGVLSLGILAARVVRPGLAGAPTGSSTPGLAERFRVAVKSPAPFGVAIAFGGLFVAMRLFENNPIPVNAL